MIADSKPLSLVHRYRPAREASTGPTPLLVLLHGLGSNEEDLFGLAPYFHPRIAIVSARAPLPYSMGGYSWFEMAFTPQGLQMNMESALACRDNVVRFMKEAQSAYGSAPAQTYLGGFSQGGGMTAGVLLAEPNLLAGAIIMGGYVPTDLPVGETAPLSGKPIIMTHGEYDNVVPVQIARVARPWLESLGLTVDYHEYPMAHQLSEDCIDDIDQWLVKRIGIE